jgi:hypothetical protein
MESSVTGLQSQDCQPLVVYIRALHGTGEYHAHNNLPPLRPNPEDIVDNQVRDFGVELVEVRFELEVEARLR